MLEGEDRLTKRGHAGGEDPLDHPVVRVAFRRASPSRWMATSMPEPSLRRQRTSRVGEGRRPRRSMNPVRSSASRWETSLLAGPRDLRYVQPRILSAPGFQVWTTGQEIGRTRRQPDGRCVSVQHRHPPRSGSDNGYPERDIRPVPDRSARPFGDLHWGAPSGAGGDGHGIGEPFRTGQAEP